MTEIIGIIAICITIGLVVAYWILERIRIGRNLGVCTIVRIKNKRYKPSYEGFYNGSKFVKKDKKKSR